MKEIRQICELFFIAGLWIGGFYIVQFYHWDGAWMLVPLLVTLGYHSG